MASTLTAVAESKTRDAAQGSIPEMLAKLGDPYTRWLPARQYQDFRISNDGQVAGVGMLVASDPKSGRLVVLAPIKGSPADQAGIQPGDEVRCARLACIACRRAWRHHHSVGRTQALLASCGACPGLTIIDVLPATQMPVSPPGTVPCLPLLLFPLRCSL